MTKIGMVSITGQPEILYSWKFFWFEADLLQQSYDIIVTQKLKHPHSSSLVPVKQSGSQKGKNIKSHALNVMSKLHIYKLMQSGARRTMTIYVIRN